MSLGPTELVLILVLVLIVFGAGKLPQVFNSLGKGVKEFRDASEGADAATPPVATTTTTVTTTPTPAQPEVVVTPNTVVPGPTQEEVKRVDS